MDDQQPIAEEDIQPLVEEPVSLRDQIVKVRDDIKAKEDIPEKPKKVKIEKAERGRTDDGKFARKDEHTVPLKKNVAQQNEEKQPLADVSREPEIKVPTSFGPQVQTKWKELPREIQQAIAKREEETHKTLVAQDEDRLLGKQIREKGNPYLSIIKAEGGTVDRAFEEFLNTAYLLRTRSPQEKGQLLLQLANQFGADLRGATQAPAHVDPRFAQVVQELNNLKSTFQQQQVLKRQTEDSELKRQIDTFAADPVHEHFETVKAEMAALLKSGVAADLQDAYDRAVYANPQTRSTLLEQQLAQEQEKRVAEQKARADAARKAGSSIKGSPGMAAAKNGRIVQPDLRSELRAQFAAYREG